MQEQTWFLLSTVEYTNEIQVNTNAEMRHNMKYKV